MGTRGGRARIAGCRRLTSSIEHAAKLGRPPILNPSCPTVSSDAEHVKKHELIRARLADRSKAETELTNHARLKKPAIRQMQFDFLRQPALRAQSIAASTHLGHRPPS